MSQLSVNKIFFLGIGGIGMSAIARYFLSQGKSVYGYDKTPSPLTDKLIAEGAVITFEDSVAALTEEFTSAPAEDVLIVRTPAVPVNSEIFRFFEKQGYQQFKRSQVLGWISEQTPTIAVAGTHGKTTTSSLIAHVLKVAEIPFSAFLGGIANNFNSNFVLHEKPEWLVIEADEFDRSFLTLHPQIAIITSADADHLDIYGDENEFLNGFRAFVDQVKPKGQLIIHQNAYNKLGLNKPALTYCINCDAMVSASEIMPSEGMFQFSIVKGKDERQFALALPGIHNVQNAMAAYLVAKQLGINDVTINKAFMSFAGVERRFHYQLRNRQQVYIDDYAHHPSEIDAVRESLRLMYPDRKLTVVFQPHLFTRTRDFMDGFAKSLAEFDEIFLLDIYPARELPLEGITSEALLSKVRNPHKSLVSKENITEKLIKTETEVVVTLGAGDIDRLVEPIRKSLETKISKS
ncbi:MAG: UDP-N-acetylmuramate--L-alanine ligase [Bacteroidota bacterium]